MNKETDNSAKDTQSFILIFNFDFPDEKEIYLSQQQFYIKGENVIFSIFTDVSNPFHFRELKDFLDQHVLF